jgi:predicted DNA-binding protein with PD1-like motif
VTVCTTEYVSILSEPLEAHSLNGTVTLLDGRPFPRLYGAVVRSDGSVAGGHVHQAVCRKGLDLAIHAPPAATAAPPGERAGHPFNAQDAK